MAADRVSSPTPPEPQQLTFLDVVYEVAAQCGEVLTDDQAGWVLWNRTGYPSFFSPSKGETVEDVLRRQVTECFKFDWLTIGHGQTGHAFARLPRQAARSLCGRRASRVDETAELLVRCGTCSMKVAREVRP